MNRDQLLIVVEELRGVLKGHEVTLQEAETIGEMFLDNIRKSKETSIKTYAENGKFK